MWRKHCKHRISQTQSGVAAFHNYRTPSTTRVAAQR